jgi:hypothetical protein
MRVLTAVSPRRHGRPRPARSSRRARNAHDGHSFTPLIDAKAASALLGVPYTWLLAQARAGRVPHHRLWLNDTRIGPAGLNHTAERGGVAQRRLSAVEAAGVTGIPALWGESDGELAGWRPLPKCRRAPRAHCHVVPSFFEQSDTLLGARAHAPYSSEAATRPNLPQCSAYVAKRARPLRARAFERRLPAVR